MSAAAEAINPPNVKAAWPSAPLRSLCEFHNGLWKGKKGPFETATVIRNTNFTLDGRIDLSDVAVLEVEARQLAKRRLQKNDIIIEKSGGGPKQPVGRVVLFDLDVDEKYSFSNFTSAIRVVKPSEIDPAFLHRVLYWWYTSGRTEAIQSHSTGIRNLDFNAYKDLVVPLPPLEEQKRIVAILDQAFAALDRARALAEANLADAQELFEASVERLLGCGRQGWKIGRFQDLVGEVSTGPFGSLLHKSDYIEGGTPVINPSNVVAGNIEPDWTKSVSSEAATRLDSYTLRTGDLIIGRRGEMGRCAPVLPHMEGWLCGTGSFIIRPKSGVSSEFVGYLMRTPAVVAALTSIATGATMLNLSNRAIAGMTIELPKHDEQLALLEAIRSLEGKVKLLRSEVEAKLNDLANLRQSLLQKAFSGQLT